MGTPDKIDRIVAVVSRPDGEPIEERIVEDAGKLWRCAREDFAVNPERLETSPANTSPASRAPWIGGF